MVHIYFWINGLSAGYLDFIEFLAALFSPVVQIFLNLQRHKATASLFLVNDSRLRFSDYFVKRILH